MLADAGTRVSDDVAAAALDGLLAARKTLPARLFYDEAGCALFDAITRLPEYYPTRTERGLLDEAAAEIVAAAGSPDTLLEYGASDEAKAETLMARMPRLARYVPIDIAPSALEGIVSRLRRSRPGLRVHPVVGDFLAPLALPELRPGTLGFFPGSTIGNLHPEEAERFLRDAAGTLGEGAHLLVGVDTVKDRAALVAAYDDAAGTTAAFNLNLLHRLNREAGAAFVPERFAHRAAWNETASRIEMHLVSLRPQTVVVAGRDVVFAEGETIHTENSYKYRPERFAALAARAGWQARRLWQDAAGLFSLHLLAA